MEKLKKEEAAAKALSDAYEMYKKTKKVIESCIYTDQIVSANGYLNSYLRAFIGMYGINDILTLRGVFKSKLNGTYKMKRELANFLDGIAGELNEVIKAKIDSSIYREPQKVAGFAGGNDTDRRFKQFKKEMDNYIKSEEKGASDEKIGFLR